MLANLFVGRPCSRKQKMRGSTATTDHPLRKTYRSTPKMRTGALRSDNGGRLAVIGWALRWILLWGGVALLCMAVIRHGILLLPPPAASVAGPQTAQQADAASAPPTDSRSYPVDANGQVVVEAEIDGAPLRLLVDTGAFLVTLTPRDARAAGIDTDRLAFTGRLATANGVVPFAPVTLREIRIGQLAVENVPGAVDEHLGGSLLGMSFLSRLRSYRMANGRFTIAW
jgi:clan AA aspartic protease (TIGR02281 family)